MSTPEIIMPTPGRVVWYRVGRGDECVPRFNTQGFDRPDPLAAIVAGVDHARNVNLTVADANGATFARHNVLLLQPGDDVPGDGRPYAEWMPFQKGQAAKTEAAEDRLKAQWTVRLDTQGRPVHAEAAKKPQSPEDAPFLSGDIVALPSQPNDTMTVLSCRGDVVDVAYLRNHHEVARDHIPHGALILIERRRKVSQPEALRAVPGAFSALKGALHNDSGYAWGWQCNLAMSMKDAMHGHLSHAQANRAAAAAMLHIFDVDVTALPEACGMAWDSQSV